MSGMLFKNAKIRKPGAQLADKHEPRGHIRRIINGQKEKMKKIESVKNYTKPDIVTKKQQIIVKNFGSLLKGVVKEGSIVLGCVQEVQLNTMVLSIPGCLGIVDVTRICDAYTEQSKLFINTTESTVDLATLNEMFELGDILACVVVEKNTNRQFSSCDWALSINPKQVNLDIQKWNVKKKMILNCAVKSVEDHGYMMDTGCSSVFGFMPFVNAESFIETRTGSNRKLLPVGQVLPCAMSLLDGDDDDKPTNAVMLTADPQAVANSHINRSCFSAEKLHLIPPGNRVKAAVNQIRPDGIVLRIKDCKVFVPRLHLANCWQLPVDYEVGSMVKGKVLLYDKASETLLVTLRESLVENVNIVLPAINCGTVVETAEVNCIEPDLTFLKINTNFRGITRKQHLCGVEVELNSKYKCRIVNSNVLDDTVTVALHRNVVQQQCKSSDEPRCGDIVQGIAGEISEDGKYWVEIGKAVRGVITSKYLVHFPEGWKSGNELTCRVLRVDSQKGIVELVSHPRMVNSELPIISSYECAVPGLKTHGVVIGVDGTGMKVLFYNGIRTGVDMSHAITVEKRVSQYITMGDVVTCVVKSCKPEAQLLEIEIKDLQDHSGRFYSCSVIGVKTNGIDVEITENGTKEYRFIPKYHLSDSSELNDLLLKTFHVGDTLKTVVSIKKQILSRKMSSIHYYTTHEPSPDDKKVGNVLPCFEACAKKGGEIVVLAGGFYAVICSQEPVTNLEIGNIPGFVQITSVTSSGKLICKVLPRLQVPMTLRVKFLKSYLQDLFRVQKDMFPEMWKSMCVGKIVDFDADTSTKQISCIQGTVSGREAIVFEDHYNGLTTESCKAVIVYLDPFKNRIEVSCREDFIKLLTPCKTKKLPKPKERHLCTCLFVKSQFVVAALNGTFKKKVVYLPGVEYANTKLTDVPPFEIGSQLLVSIRTVKKNYCIGTFVESVSQPENAERKRCLDEEDSEKKSGKKLKKKVVS